VKCFLLDGGVAEDSKPSSSVFLIAESFKETISFLLRALETSGIATGNVIDAVLIGGIILGLTGLELRGVLASFCGVELDRLLDAASTLATTAGTAVNIVACEPLTGELPEVLTGTAAVLPLLKLLIISSLLPGPMLTRNFLSESFLRGEFDIWLGRALRGLVDGLFFLSEPLVLAKFNGDI